MPKNMVVQIEVITSKTRDALYINGFHIAGRKPASSARIIRQWNVPAEKLQQFVVPQKTPAKKYGCGGNGEPCGEPRCPGCPEK